jgi:uncharacterized protein YjcR
MEIEIIKNKVHEIRGQKVMLDFDLANLYDIENKALKQSVKRNIIRFPSDFMFEISREEYNSLRSQIVTLENNGRGKYSKYLPYAFTEQGIAMLSSVLKSDIAIEINIAIMRAFVTIRQFSLNYSELKTKIEEIEQKFPDIYNALNFLMNKDKAKDSQEERIKIGYKK